MSIKLDLERKSNESLRVVFRITVAQQFRIYTADLPWMTPPDLTFIVMPLYGGEGLRRVYILNSPVTGMTLLRPGETYEGSIDLVNFFPDVLKANSKEELLFFWHWSPDDLASPPSKDIGGWIRIPRPSPR